MILPDGGRGYLSKIFNDSWMRSYGFLAADEGATVADVLRTKTGALPDLVHTHPNETVRDAIAILHEYGVSQMPVVGAEPPVKIGEVAGVGQRARAARRGVLGRGGAGRPRRPAHVGRRCR